VDAVQQIFPVTASVLAYGPESAINKVRSVFHRILVEDRSDLSAKEIAGLIDSPDCATAHAALAAALIDAGSALPKAGGKQVGLRMRLPELTERFLTLELLDLPFAKTATCLLDWESPNDQHRHQVLWLAGGMQQSEQPLA
jgi:hypothetical protein